MVRSLLIIFCCVGCAVTLHAQTVFNGRVLEHKTRIVLHGVIVENLSNKLKNITGDDGRFSIAAKVGDLLVFKKFSYAPDTLLLTDMHDREIFLQLQSTMLKDVIIRDSSGKTGVAEKNMTYYDPQYHGQTLVPHLDRNKQEDGGAVFRIHYFTKDDKDKKKAAEKEEDREVNEEIIKVFSPDNIGKYVPLKGKDMDNFIVLYMPDVKTYNSKDFNLLSYLNDCYQKWLKLSDDERKASQIFQH
jgi:hypothetical protein